MKKLTAMLLAVVMLAALCACGGGSGAKEVDLDALAAELTGSDVFSDILNQPADGVAARLYDIEDGAAKKVILYVGTGATAEEIFLAEASDASAAAGLKAACEERVSDQKTMFANYAPGEVAKLDDAILVTSGNYVILVVAADAAAARGIVENYT